MKIIIKDKDNKVIKVYENITNPIQVSVIASKHEFWEYYADNR
jgi:hypothetical protein